MGYPSNGLNAGAAIGAADATHLEGCLAALSNEVGRLSDRALSIRNFANTLAGTEIENQKTADAGGLRAVSDSMVDRFRDSLRLMESILNSMAHDSGRIERALRG